MAEKSITKSFSRDLMYSIAGLVCMNGTIQLVVYPALQSRMGADAFGVALSLFSVVSIMCCAYGSGANYSRMVAAAREDVVKGDYSVFILVISLISIIVSVISIFAVGWSDAANLIGLSALMVFSIVRYYSDVDFRLSLNYKGFFIYYLVVSVGYLVGTGILWFGSSYIAISEWWWISIALGEAAAFVYVRIKGSIYQKPYLEHSEQFKTHIKSIVTLSSAYLISATIMNADRILILAFVGAAEVSIFYTASLLGKTVALLTSPLNGVIVGYLSKRKEPITRSMVVKFTGIMLALGVVLSVLTTVASYVFVWLLYPNLFEAAQPFFIVASVGQVFYFLGETMLVILLQIAVERFQFYINIFYAVLFFGAAVPSVIFGGVMGIAWAILIVNGIRLATVVLVALKKAKPSAKTVD